MKKLIIAVVVLIAIISQLTTAFAYGLLPDPTPIPEATPTPEVEIIPITPEPEPTPTLEETPTPTPEIPTLPTDETIPIPTSIIMKAIRPLSLPTGTETPEEKTAIIESNIDSIIVSITFLQKARGIDIKDMQAVLAQITDGISEFSEKQIDNLASVTTAIDNEIVMSIFSGGITQEDINRMTAQLVEAMRITGLESDIFLEDTTRLEMYIVIVIVLLGVIVGFQAAGIWANSFKP